MLSSATMARRGAALPLAAALAVALLSGCAALKRDHIEVGAIPDDYRTNHPIVIGEKVETLDIPVAADGYRMTRNQSDLVKGFLYSYDREAGPAVTILVPHDAANSGAASAVAVDIGRMMRHSGVADVYVAHYQAGAPGAAAPIRITYTAIRAHTDKCGRWPEDLLETSENRHYANFGCAYQNNLAAQVANPNDLIGPRQPTEIDAENRGAVIDAYRNREISDEFLGNSEVTY